MQLGTTFHTVSHSACLVYRPTSFFFRWKRSALFCCPGRIEIKYLFSWLLHRCRNVFWNTKALTDASGFFFSNLGGYSATNTRTRALFLKYTDKFWNQIRSTTSTYYCVELPARVWDIEWWWYELRERYYTGSVWSDIRGDGGVYWDNFAVHIFCEA